MTRVLGVRVALPGEQPGQRRHAVDVEHAGLLDALDQGPQPCLGLLPPAGAQQQQAPVQLEVVRVRPEAAFERERQSVGDALGQLVVVAEPEQQLGEIGVTAGNVLVPTVAFGEGEADPQCGQSERAGPVGLHQPEVVQAQRVEVGSLGLRSERPSTIERGGGVVEAADEREDRSGVGEPVGQCRGRAGVLEHLDGTLDRALGLGGAAGHVDVARLTHEGLAEHHLFAQAARSARRRHAPRRQRPRSGARCTAPTRTRPTTGRGRDRSTDRRRAARRPAG